ncbi:MAG: Mur ligase family protein [Bacteriovoracaceae bacterium]|nr:Mur ligase family protein [Bacteriovoracaceae bacterium]
MEKRAYDLTNLLVGDDLASKRDSIKKIFFYRICGTGMGACACLLKEAGYDVSGADQNFYPPMSTYLESTKIPLYKLDEVNNEFLQQFDLVIIGNSVPGNSEAAGMIEKSGVPFTSFPSVLGAFVLKDKNVIGAAGTHGKTTTTYFMTQILNNLGIDTGYFIGGILDDNPPSKIGKDKYFVIESDEYDSCYFQKFSKFRLYELNKMILTSLEFDHADIYDNVEQIEDEFKAVFDKLDYVAANTDYKSIVKLQNEYPNTKVLSYGSLNPKDIKLEAKGSHFTVSFNNTNYDFSTNVVGLHNILNITSCILVLFEDGFSYEKLKDAVSELSLVKRRQEERGFYKDMLVIDDFAHHPRAISLTVDAIKTKYPTKKIITVFEPVSATARSNYFQNEFKDSLLNSDQVIIARSGIKTTAKSNKDLDCEKLVSDIGLKGIPATCVENLDSLRKVIDDVSHKDSLLLVLSNRSCIGLWESDFAENLTR